MNATTSLNQPSQNSTKNAMTSRTNSITSLNEKDSNIIDKIE